MTDTPFRLDRDYDRRNADAGTRSRYGNYLNQRSATFAKIESYGYDDPSVEFAAAAWRIATGPVMAPPFVVFPKRVLSATLERSYWDGEAILNVDLIGNRPDALRGAKTGAGSWYYDWPQNLSGDYKSVGGQELVSGVYLLTRVQVLLRLPPGTLPTVTEIPTRGDALLRQAIDCGTVLVRVLNNEIGPIIEQMEAGR